MRDQIERFDMQASLALLHGLYEVAAFPREVSPSERAVILTAARAKLKAAYRQAQRLCDAETRRKVLDRRERIVNLRCCLKSDDLFFTSCQTAFPELDADQVRLELELWARDLPRAMKRAKAKGRRAKSKGRRPRTEGDEGIPY